jgi:uncharacterized protein YoxC
MWDTIGGVIGIVLFLITIVNISVKVSKAFTELSKSNDTLSESVDNLNNTIQKLTDDNEAEHDEIYETLEEHNITLNKTEVV